MRNFSRFLKKYKIFVIVILLFFVVGIISIPIIFANLQPLRSIEITSKKLSYTDNDDGAWKITKSAKLLSNQEAIVNFDVDTVLKNSDYNLDLLLVLDTSESMHTNRLDSVKTATMGLIENVLSNNKNKVGLISFNSTSTIESQLSMINLV